jgi:hypothetical protein
MQNATVDYAAVDVNTDSDKLPSSLMLSCLQHSKPDWCVSSCDIGLCAAAAHGSSSDATMSHCPYKLILVLFLRDSSTILHVMTARRSTSASLLHHCQRKNNQKGNCPQYHGITKTLVTDTCLHCLSTSTRPLRTCHLTWTVWCKVHRM